jgi:hypothetical protein
VQRREDALVDRHLTDSVLELESRVVVRRALAAVEVGKGHDVTVLLQRSGDLVLDGAQTQNGMEEYDVCY